MENRIDSIFDVKAINEETAQVSKMLYGIIDLQKQISGNSKQMATDCCVGPLKRPPIHDLLPESIYQAIHERMRQASGCWAKLEGAGLFNSERASALSQELCHLIAAHARSIVKYQEEHGYKG